MYSRGELREECREKSTRPVIKHCQQSSLQKAHDTRIDDLYHQRPMSETVFSLLKNGEGDKLRSRT
jgi:IS5 family transposase